MDLRWWYLGDYTLVSAIPDAISTFSFPYFSVICSTARAGMKACSGTYLDPSILFVTTRVFEPMLSAPFCMSDLSVFYYVLQFRGQAHIAFEEPVFHGDDRFGFNRHAAEIALDDHIPSRFGNVTVD